MNSGPQTSSALNFFDEPEDPEPQRRGSRQDEAMQKAPEDIRSLYEEVRRFFGFKRAEGFIHQNLTRYVHKYRPFLLQFLLRVDEESYRETRTLPPGTLGAMNAVAQQVRDCLLLNAVVVAEAALSKATKALDRMERPESPDLDIVVEGESKRK